MRRLKLSLIVAALVVCPPVVSAAPVYLGAANPASWTALSLGGDLRIEGDGGTVTGNVGVTGPSEFRLDKATVDGDLYMETGTTSIIGGHGVITGLTNTSSDALLQQAVADALSYSASYAAMSCTFGALCGSSLTNSEIIDVGGGTNVLNLTNLDLNGQALTFNGTGGDGQLIINILGDFLVAQSQILLMGDLTNLEVLFNVIGTGNKVSAFKDSTEVHGILLATHRDITVQDGKDDKRLDWYGSLIGATEGYDFRIQSGADVTGQQVVVPEINGSKIGIALTLLLSLVLLYREREGFQA